MENMFSIMMHYCHKGKYQLRENKQLHNYFEVVIYSSESFATAEIFIFSKSKIIFLAISAIDATIVLRCSNESDLKGLSETVKISQISQETWKIQTKKWA